MANAIGVQKLCSDWKYCRVTLFIAHKNGFRSVGENSVNCKTYCFDVELNDRIKNVILLVYFHVPFFIQISGKKLQINF